MSGQSIKYGTKINKNKTKEQFIQREIWILICEKYWEIQCFFFHLKNNTIQFKIDSSIDGNYTVQWYFITTL